MCKLTDTITVRRLLFFCAGVKMFGIPMICYLLIQILGMIRSDIDLRKEEDKEIEYYTNTWAVRVLGGVSKAKKIAIKLGFDPDIEVSEGLPNFYLFRNPKYPEKMKQANEHFTKKLRGKAEIEWVNQQVAFRLISSIQYPRIPLPKKIKSLLSPSRSAKKRKPAQWIPLSPPTDNSCLNMNDKYWSRQYYIQDCGDGTAEKPPHDLQVVPAWINHRLSGKNIKVIVVDDGIETDHPDLKDNYDPKLGLDLQDNDSKPDPVHYWWHKFSHGTRCAGVIAMRANNSICGVGIAPAVTLGAVRLQGPNLKREFDIVRALLFKFNEVDIISNSWTMSHNTKSIWYGGLLSASALKAGTTKGRGGKGLIYVFSSGSRKFRGLNCGMDALLNSVHTITVASCDYRGKITDFSERCSSIMVTTYSGLGFPLLNHDIVSTDVGHGCTVNHGGTSASAPMISAAVALALEANPELTSRDVQHLLAWTSQVAPLQKNPPNTWMKNGAGFYVSHDFGFGILDVNELVEKAKGFPKTPPENVCVTKIKLWKDEQRFHCGLVVKITPDGCEGYSSEVKYLEHVQVSLSLRYPRRGDLQLDLTSPSGTKATLLEPRLFDSYAYGITAWTFESVMTWGENPKGIWTVSIFKNRKPCVGFTLKTAWSTIKNVTSIKVLRQNSANVSYPGVLKELYLIFYGTSGKNKPQHYEAGQRPYFNFTLPS